MSRYRFELASEADDPELRSILAQTPMPGAISVAFGREPSYFQAAVVEGRFRQVMVVRDETSGQLVGVGSRSVSVRYVNGRPTPIGYLSNLRLLEEHRGQRLLARGYEFLRDLHQDGRTPLYLSTIAAGNQPALAALTTGRAGLPTYHPAGRYHTLAIPLARARRTHSESAAVEVRPARRDDVPAIMEFLNRVGPQREFFPCYEAEDFFNGGGVLRDLRPDDLLLAFRDGHVVGTLAGWDQQAFRQDVIHGYGRPLNWVRPLYNAWAGLRRHPQLPRPGAPLSCLTAALPLVEDDDPSVFTVLLDELRCRHSGGKWDYLLLALHESDPLLAAVNLPACRYTTNVFTVCWEDGAPLRRSLSSRPLYLELGSL
jgi:hypothetical protein